MNKPPYGTQIRNLNPLELFKVSAQDKPNNTVRIAAGVYTVASGSIIEYIGGNTTNIVPPTAGSAWVLICLGPNANIVISSNAVNPPLVPKNHLGLALVFQKSTDLVISNDMIFDVRPVYVNTTYAVAHNDLSNNSIPDCHPISSISNLTDTLNNKVSVVDFDNALLNKSDLDGTINTTFILNKDYTGAPTESVEFIVERGSEANVSFRYNETLNKWEFTNDGSVFFDFSNLGSISNANLTTIGKVQLSIDPLDTNVPIAVGDNDPRLANLVTVSSLDLKADLATTYSISATDVLLLAKADQAATFTKTEVTDALALKANKQTGISGTFTTVDGKTITITDGIVTSIV